MSWDAEALWQKARLYVQRAQQEDRDGDLYPLWTTVALEFLARSALAKVHPVLLADHRDPDNVMYAFGYLPTGKSVSSTTVFRRCERVVADFTSSETKQCIALLDRRNAELHSGADGFADYPQSRWLAQYYRIAKMLCESIGKTLDDLFGTEEARAAAVMIASLEERVLESVRSAVIETRERYEGLDPESKAVERQRNFARFEDTSADVGTDEVECPACGRTALLRGDVIGTGEARVDEDDYIVQPVIVLPTELACTTCGLHLNSHAQVSAAGFGGQRTQNLLFDRVEFFNILAEREHTHPE